MWVMTGGECVDADVVCGPTSRESIRKTAGAGWKGSRSRAGKLEDIEELQGAMTEYVRPDVHGVRR